MWHPWGGHDNRRNSFWSCVIASYEDPVSTTAVCAFLPLPHHSRILTWSPSTTISIMSINHNDVAGRKYWTDDGTLLVRVQQAAYKLRPDSLNQLSSRFASFPRTHDSQHNLTSVTVPAELEISSDDFETLLDYVYNDMCVVLLPCNHL